MPEPEIESPNDVIVRVAYCGVCGSDLHCSEKKADGSVLFGGPARLPVVLGHEFTGTVMRAGVAVKGVAPGDLVTAESIWACWSCAECRAGHLNECERGELLGLTVNGAMAPLVRVDARHCHGLRPLVDRYGGRGALELGTLVEPFGVAWRGLARARLRADDRLVVVGAGPIGLAIILLARAAGVTRIVAFDVLDSRVALAESAGARAFNPAPLVERGVSLERVATDVVGAPSLAVEAAGTAPAFESAFRSLANRGRLLVLGRMPARVPFDTNELLSKSLTVIGSRGHAGKDVFREVIERMTSGSIDPSWLITARFDLSRAREAFAHARLGAGAKTLVRVDDSLH